jgi:hypothetical protein
LASQLHLRAVVRRTGFPTAGFRPVSHGGPLSAGWRRAYRLSGWGVKPSASEMPNKVSNPLDREEKSAIVKSVDANVPPDQPPSTVDSPSRAPRLGLSATGIAIASGRFLNPSSAQVSVASPGCGVTPPGLTY